MIDAHFTRVNLIGRDWRALADFYRRVYGCVTDPEGNILELRSWSG